MKTDELTFMDKLALTIGKLVIAGFVFNAINALGTKIEMTCTKKTCTDEPVVVEVEETS